MMLFNIKPCRWQSVARQEFEQRPELLQTPNDRGAYKQKTMCSNFKDMARRGAALLVRCATPLRLFGDNAELL